MSNINIRIDGDIKSSAEKVFARLGLTPTTAIVLFYNQVIRTNSIPFELKADMPNEKTVKALRLRWTGGNYGGHTAGCRCFPLR